MKRILVLLTVMSLMVGCNAGEGKSISELEAELVQKKATLEAVKQSGGYPNVSLSAVCARGVLYYQTPSYYGYFNYVPAISSETLLPERCAGAQQ